MHVSNDVCMCDIAPSYTLGANVTPLRGQEKDGDSRARDCHLVCLCMYVSVRMCVCVCVYERERAQDIE